MSAPEVDRPVKMDTNKTSNNPIKENEKINNKKGNFIKKFKHDDGRNFKFNRKRAHPNMMGTNKYITPYKRRKKDGGLIVPPTKFLLGGNIRDPLNLNSLRDEEINRAMNAVTPKSSPLPTPRHRKEKLEVIIPPNLHDPLNLISCDDDAEYVNTLVSPTKKCRKSKKKKKRNSSSGGSNKDEGEQIANNLSLEFSREDEPLPPVEISEPEKATSKEPSELAELEESVEKGEAPSRPVEVPLPPPAPQASSPSKDKRPRKSLDELKIKNRKMDFKDKIVSPVIPQPGAWLKRSGLSRPNLGQNSKKKSNFNAKQAKFRYGNYNRYYGYRNPHYEEDSRLKCFHDRWELFHEKDILDIGCNIGHVTLTIARDYGARSVVGLDIDRKLVEIARTNVKHYVNRVDSPWDERGNHERNNRVIDTGRSNSAGYKYFPISMPILFGPVDLPGISDKLGNTEFPHNVSFVQGNYILDSDTLLSTEQARFDSILCLSVTKWLHLNWGDAGLKQAFKRMYAQLRPGGHLILEAQSWDSYKKKKNLTETIYKNFSSIKFYPNKFTQYLLSQEVGFTQCEVIATPMHHSKGFQRPIQLFTKGGHSTPSHSRSNNQNPSHDIPKSSKGSQRDPPSQDIVGDETQVTQQDDHSENALPTTLPDKSCPGNEEQMLVDKEEHSVDCVKVKSNCDDESVITQELEEVRIELVKKDLNNFLGDIEPNST